jgi:GNAT superfamily N-acetyltransferase
MLSVRLDLQKAGVGRRLLAAAETMPGPRARSGWKMTVIHIRDTLIAYYERRGFHRAGFEPFLPTAPADWHGAIDYKGWTAASTP